MLRHHFYCRGVFLRHKIFIDGDGNIGQTEINTQDMQPQMSVNTVYEQKNGDEFTQTSDIVPQPPSGNAWNDGDAPIENDDNDSTWTSQHGEVVGKLRLLS